jgi:hypothetical protein
MPFLKELFSGGASKLVDSVGKVLDEVTTSKEERMQLEQEMRKAEMQYEIEKRKLNVEEQALYLQDVSSARTRETALQTSSTATKLGKNVGSYLAIGATLLCFGMFYILVFTDCIDEKDQSKKDIVIYVLGVLSTLLAQIYSYYFGSSSGSADKGRMISDVLKSKE